MFVCKKYMVKLVKTFTAHDTTFALMYNFIFNLGVLFKPEGSPPILRHRREMIVLVRLTGLNVESFRYLVKCAS
jgi:hypothetical protein